TPPAVSPCAHRGKTPEFAVNMKVDFNVRRAVWYRSASFGFSSSQSVIRLRMAAPVNSAMEGSTTLKYFLSSNSERSHGGLPTTHENPPAHPAAGSTAPLSEDALPSSGTAKMFGNSRCQWKKAYCSR